jgi:hypothetical protein
MNYLDFDRYMILQRNDELLREVQELRLENCLRANRRPRSGCPLANNLLCRSLLSLLRRADPSE